MIEVKKKQLGKIKADKRWQKILGCIPDRCIFQWKIIVFMKTSLFNKGKSESATDLKILLLIIFPADQ